MDQLPPSHTPPPLPPAAHSAPTQPPIFVSAAPPRRGGRGWMVLSLVLLGIIGLMMVGRMASFLMGGGKDHLEDVGGLGTAQRNTAAGVIIATQNFDDPNVLVMLTLANTLGIVMLLFIAKRLSRDNKITTRTV